MKNFRSPCCIQIPSRPVSYTGGWAAEKEILTVVASIVVHCCTIEKNVIVASQLYDVANVQFTVEKEAPLELLQFIQKYNLGNSVPNAVIMLRIFFTIAVSVATCEKRVSKLKLIKNCLSLSTLRLKNLASCHTVHGATIDRWNKFWHCPVIEDFANKKARKVTV